jgi:signal transduction histidine kinase
MKSVADSNPVSLWSGCLLIIAVLTWQAVDRSSHQAEHREEHQRRGVTLLKAFEAVAFRSLRGGRYDPETLPAMLEQTRVDLEASWLAIRGPEPTLIASAGVPPPEGSDHSVFERPFEPLRPRGMGNGFRRGMGSGMRELPTSGLSLVLVLSPDERNAKLGDDTRRAIVTAAALVLAIVLFVGLSWFRSRTQRLRSHQAVDQAKIRNLEYLRRLGAGLVHETKNPLGVVRGFAQRIVREPLDPENLQKSARAILSETDRTVARLDEFLLLSRPAQLRMESFSVKQLFQDVVALVEPDVSQLSARVEVRAEDEVLHADREQLRRLLLNLLLNSVSALQPGGLITMTAENRGATLHLAVIDDGDGVPDGIRDSLFEPYVTGRPSGTGLGLSIAQRIAADHGFTLSCEPNEPRGTRMILEVPCP